MTTKNLSDEFDTTDLEKEIIERIIEDVNLKYRNTIRIKKNTPMWNIAKDIIIDTTQRLKQKTADAVKKILEDINKHPMDEYDIPKGAVKEILKKHLGEELTGGKA